MKASQRVTHFFYAPIVPYRLNFLLQLFLAHLTVRLLTHVQTSFRAMIRWRVATVAALSVLEAERSRFDADSRIVRRLPRQLHLLASTLSRQLLSLAHRLLPLHSLVTLQALTERVQ